MDKGILLSYLGWKECQAEDLNLLTSPAVSQRIVSQEATFTPALHTAYSSTVIHSYTWGLTIIKQFKHLFPATRTPLLLYSFSDSPCECLLEFIFAKVNIDSFSFTGYSKSSLWLYSTMPSLVTFVNRCSYNIELMETGPGYGPNLLCSLAPGASISKTNTGPGLNFWVCGLWMNMYFGSDLA